MDLDDDPYRPPAWEPELPDPPQVRELAEDSPELFRKSVRGGGVAALVVTAIVFFVVTMLLGAGGFYESLTARMILVAALPAGLCGLGAWIGFVFLRRRLFAPRPRRRRGRY
jgi:hypothetical protein